MLKRWLAPLVCLASVLGCSSQTETSRPTRDSQEEIRARPRAATTCAEDQPCSDSAIARALALQSAHETIVASLQSSCLPPAQLAEGWIRLYDNHSQLGWFYMGTANWHFENGAITADTGEPCVLCTSFQISDFEMLIDFKCPAGTNSGIFLRSTADPRDVERECYELNIAPPDNPFPTGSLVKRQKVEPTQIGTLDPEAWHNYRIVCQDQHVQVWLDGQQIVDYTDPGKLRTGHIGLQYREGAISFRNILLRPLGGQKLSTGADWQDHWTTIESSRGRLKVESRDEALHLQGGPAQLESKTEWKDAIIQAVYKTGRPDVDSGLLFRCTGARLGEGYEMPIYHGPYDRQAKRKLQTGALSIPFKGQYANARALVGDGSQPTYVTIVADQSQFTTFVNGLLIQDLADSRDINANPQAGCRLTGGPIALATDQPDTDVTFSQISISQIHH